ncbi:DUF6427 family protein [Aurantibacter sp.]|uniref:DUF6427 family protein n=1 Tax=Aurantibacter sp. TaxID=2807103 RepID=UPI0035C7BA3C
MITSFFNKSKPNNYVIIFLLALLGFVIAVFKYNTLPFNLFNVLKLTFNFGLTCVSIFTLNFIVKRNSLTKENTYAVLVYCFALLLLPQTFLNVKIIISNLFIILALRRLLSLSSKKNTIKKLFDFGVLITIAALFNSWAISGFIFVFFALIYYPEKRFNYWIIPFLGVLAVSIIVYSVYLYFPDRFSDVNLIFYYKWLTITTFNWPINLANVLLLLFAFYGLLIYLSGIKNKKRIKQSAFYLVTFAFLVLIFISIVQPIKTVSELLFVFMPLAIIGANALENQTLKLINEIFLLVCIMCIALITFI